MIDLRSDTVTRPTNAMRRAMAESAVGDDVFWGGSDGRPVGGVRGGATQQGGGPLLPFGDDNEPDRGTRRDRSRRRSDTIRGEDACVFNYEAGAPALLSGVQVRPVPAKEGVVSPETLRGVIRPENVHFPRPKLLCLENTHNVAGGKVFPLEGFAVVAAEARSLCLGVHLDGARLFNAQASTSIPAREWGARRYGLGLLLQGPRAPVESLLAGDEEIIREARRARKAFGGGMRQAGVIAAASLYAFEHRVERLVEDHERARRLAAGLAGTGYQIEPPETNIVLVWVEEPQGFLRALAQQGVLATPGKAGHVRLCTHLDFGDEDIDAAVEVACGLAAHILER